MVPIAHRVLDRFGAIPSALDRGRLRLVILYKHNYVSTLGHSGSSRARRRRWRASPGPTPTW
ncbi:MAG: hypothetical protein R2939_20090 [Kofleriaceae bacterium]